MEGLADRLQGLSERLLVIAEEDTIRGKVFQLCPGTVCGITGNDFCLRKGISQGCCPSVVAFPRRFLLESAHHVGSRHDNDEFMAVFCSFTDEVKMTGMQAIKNTEHHTSLVGEFQLRGRRFHRDFHSLSVPSFFLCHPGLACPPLEGPGIQKQARLWSWDSRLRGNDRNL